MRYRAGAARIESGGCRMDGKTGLKKVSISSFGIAIMLYCLVASGAFGIEEIVPIAGPGMTIALLAIFPFIWGLPISSLVAECNSLMPAEGGVQIWSRAAFGEFWGFQVGWWAIISTYISSGEYVALAGAYAEQLFGLDPTGSFVVKVAMIALFTAINIIGFREVEESDAILSIIIIAVFGLVTVVGLASWQTNPFEPFVAPGLEGGDLAEAILLCVWMYCGFECIAAMGGEIADPRSVSRGLKIALPLIALSYILPTLAGLAALPAGSWEDWGVDGGMMGETLGYASVLSQVFGGIGPMLFLPVAIFSNCAIYNTYMASGSRNLFALAEDGLFPKGVAKLSRHGRVPYIGILTITISSLIFCQLEFTVLVELEVVFILATYVVLALTVLKLRKMYPVEGRTREGGYSIRGGKVGLAWCAALPIVISLVALFMSDLEYLLYGIAAMGTGVVAYAICKRVYGGHRAGAPLASQASVEDSMFGAPAAGEHDGAPAGEGAGEGDGGAIGREASDGAVSSGRPYPLNPEDAGHITLFVGILVALAVIGLALNML